MRARSSLLVFALSFPLLASCGNEPPAPPPTKPPQKPDPKAAFTPTVIKDDAATALRERAPSPRVTRNARVVAWTRQGDDEWFCLDMEREPTRGWRGGTIDVVGRSADAHVDAIALPDMAVSLDPKARPGSTTGKTCNLLVHAISKKPVDALSLALHWRWNENRHELRSEDASIEVPKDRPKDAAVARAWIQGVSDSVGSRRLSAFGVFATHRLEPLLGKPSTTSTSAVWQESSRSEGLAEAMGWFDGVDEVQEALENRRPLFLNAPAASKNPSVHFKTLAGPELESFPWARMTAKLGAVTPRKEALAAFTPAGFYYARVATVPKLVALLDEYEHFWTGVLAERDTSWSRDASTRYPSELGLPHTGAAKLLSSDVVGEVAIVGSDPYLQEGTDVSVLFQVKNQALFDAAMQAAVQLTANAHGAVGESTAPDGTKRYLSQDGAVNSVRTCLHSTCIVSNSAAAVARIVDAANGKAPKLSDEPDFAFMLARESQRGAAEPLDDVLAYLGERFVREVSGPRQKIAEARRERALMELRAPGFAELLFGLVYGREPTSVQELVAKKMLLKGELTHASGEAIEYKLGMAARSQWGTVASLEPLLDLPPVTKVTAAEADAYKRFATSYRQSYERYIDPIVLTARIDTSGASPAFTYDMRILPPSQRTLGHESARWMNDFGLGRIRAASVDQNGAHVAVGIGRGSALRRELTQATVSLVGSQRFTLDWLGDWAQAGCFDTNAVLNLANTFGQPDRSEDDGWMRRTLALPAYVAVEVKDKAALGVVIAKARAELESVLPKTFVWGPAFSHRGAEVVSIGAAAEDGEERSGERALFAAVHVFYTVHAGRLIITLREDVMRRVLELGESGFFATADRVDKDTKGKAGEESPDSVNMSIDTKLVAGGGFEKAMVLFGAAEHDSEFLASRSGADAAALFRGIAGAASDEAVFDAAARRIFGAIPMTPGYGRFRYGQDPVSTNPVGVLMQHLAAVSLQTSLDRERGVGTDADPRRSIHLRGEIRTRPR